MAEEWTHHEGVVNNVRLHWVEQGAGPLVVLLHGFPEFWWGWHRQIPALAAAGFRVVAPDLRGYNLSEKPKGAGSYRVSILAQDVASLIHHLGEERAHVAGHDWGGVVAWRLALAHPERVDRLIVLNAPHPAVFNRELKRPRQFLRSWYAMFFQLPLLPEAVFRANDYATLERIFRKSPARPGAFSDDDVRRYKEAMARPGALTAMLAYYRTFARTLGSSGGSGGREAKRTVTRPTLVIWGERDTALNPHNLDGLEEYVPDLRIERLPASHWVLADEPERVSERMIRFLRGEG
ncbi:MAG TPA: alpha/beta hydrolase [Longimicrobium sp.]|jgi:pimeloyl-ACP methyl ester carboxylesterase|nr:alpha/beta hydrolase [Longimicrobium sp.]